MDDILKKLSDYTMDLSYLLALPLFIDGKLVSEEEIFRWAAEYLRKRYGI